LGFDLLHHLIEQALKSLGSQALTEAALEYPSYMVLLHVLAAPVKNCLNNFPSAAFQGLPFPVLYEEP
jgi:hypothetical protein